MDEALVPTIKLLYSFSGGYPRNTGATDVEGQDAVVTQAPPVQGILRIMGKRFELRMKAVHTQVIHSHPDHSRPVLI